MSYSSIKSLAFIGLLMCLLVLAIILAFIETPRQVPKWVLFILAVFTIFFFTLLFVLP